MRQVSLHAGSSPTNERLAAPYYSIKSGKATCVRRIEASDFLEINESVAVWRQDMDVFLQCLDFQDDGSLYPTRKLNIQQHIVSPRSHFMLWSNKEGYLIVQENIELNQSRYDVTCSGGIMTYRANEQLLGFVSSISTPESCCGHSKTRISRKYVL